jgi:Tol biopolymer transport system component
MVARVSGNQLDLSWSPGGKWLAYDSSDRSGTRRVLRVVRADGRRSHIVGSLALAVAPHAWSPDGRRLAFIGRNGVVTANLDGSHRRLLDRYRPLRYPCCGPAWSPNGRQIAYFRSTGGDQRGTLALIAPNGRSKRKLTETSYTDKIFWARDGRRLYYAAQGD